ncbi:MAG: PLP-dependent aminotransferase family protein [Aestuariivirga sp.]
MSVSFDIETIALDPSGTGNLHRQLYQQLRRMIESGVLRSGSPLPSTRQLARKLAIGRNSVIYAYDQLALEGYIATRRGAPPVVVDLPMRNSKKRTWSRTAASRLSERGRVLTAQRYHHGEPGHMAFHPGMPDPDNFPFNTWSKLLARRAKSARRDLFGAYYVQGYPPLREAIARYLTVSRGVTCSPDQIVITNGAQSAFDILARLLLDPGDTVWMEEPGYYGASAAFLSADARLAPLRVTDDGWNLEPQETPPRVIFVTPSCHHPLGITMPMEQRLNLIRLAEAWNAWIIEDDYDSEYRFLGHPIPALQGFDAANRVIYVGTFAKMLFSAMRLGFMVVPPQLGKGIVAALSATGQFAPLLTQAALADFMNEGHLTRHLRRMKRLYAARRQDFLDICDRHLSAWLQLRPMEAGIQLVAYLRPGLEDRVVAAAAQKQGINVSPLSLQFQHPSTQQGLVLGFAGADAKATEKCARKLRDILLSLAPKPNS